MKNNKNKLSAIEQFQRDIISSLGQYQSRLISERVKRAWQKRKQLSTNNKVAM